MLAEYRNSVYVAQGVGLQSASEHESVFIL